jgi:hypothetical protein
MSYLQKPSDEILWQSSGGLLLGAEVLHDLGKLLPVVQRFLLVSAVSICTIDIIRAFTPPD